jgi:hypothetical protein
MLPNQRQVLLQSVSGASCFKTDAAAFGQLVTTLQSDARYQIWAAKDMWAGGFAIGLVLAD